MNIFDVYWISKTRQDILSQIEGYRYNDDHAWKAIKMDILSGNNVESVKLGDAGLKRLYVKIVRKGKTIVFIFTVADDGWKVVDECCI